MKKFVFGGAAGLVVSIAGTSIVDEPVKTIALIFAICLAHQFTMERS